MKVPPERDADRRPVPLRSGSRSPEAPPPGGARLATEWGDPRPQGAPPAIWAAFAIQGAWKSWTIAGLLGTVALLAVAVARLATRPPEVVLIDANGIATPIRRSIASDALLKFIGEHARPAEPTVVRFTRDFLHLALAMNSSTVAANWPAALALMTPELRARVESEASTRRLVETWLGAQRKTDLSFEQVAVEDRMPGELAVRAVLGRRTGSLYDGSAASTDRVEVELVERIVPPTLERPDGLEVADWRLSTLPRPSPQPRVLPGGGGPGVSGRAGPP
ncbi:MAG TPA: hypothetical protein VMK42_19975 [Anaeromyxobacteraceae bacterium]|nr:hypothetical protein [Anaeromyxobacteraceae bacterium]